MLEIIRRVLNAAPILVRAVRPVIVVLAWPCFLLLLAGWVIELVYSFQHYVHGGWPGLMGYVQGLGPSLVSWNAVLLWHLGMAIVTTLLGRFLWSSRNWPK